MQVLQSLYKIVSLNNLCMLNILQFFAHIGYCNRYESEAQNVIIPPLTSTEVRNTYLK